MPTLLQETEMKLEWTDIASRIRHPYPDPARLPGIHVSGILKYIATHAKLLNVANDDEDLEVMPLRIAMGTAWEEWVVGLYPDMIWQPGAVMDPEYEIIGSPDGLSFEVINGREEGVLEEFKCTWYSMFHKGTGNQILDRWMWMQQMRAYCWLLNLSHARLNVFWVNGDYRPPSPRYKRYLFSFSSGEIQNTADMLISNRHKAIPE